MDCNEFSMLLDAYIDDNELAADQKEAFLAHAQECENCGRALREAEMLKGILSDIDDDIVVPLEAQANWRMAVRAEAKRKSNRKWMRIGSAIAAAFILVFACTLMLNGSMFNRENELNENSEAMRMTIASDGAGDAQNSDSAEGDVYSAWRKIETDSFDLACKTIEDLSREYNGSFSVESNDSGANECVYRIEIPYEFMADFLNAAGRLGNETDSETVESKTDTAVIYIELFETK